MKKLLFMLFLLLSCINLSNCKDIAESEIKILSESINQNEGASSAYKFIKEKNNQYQYLLTVNSTVDNLIVYFTFDLNNGNLYSSATPNGKLEYIAQKDEMICKK